MGPFQKVLLVPNGPKVRNSPIFFDKHENKFMEVSKFQTPSIFLPGFFSSIFKHGLGIFIHSGGPQKA
jgi:hypothetical protein